MNLTDLYQKSYVLPFQQAIPSNRDEYLATEAFTLKRYLKFLRRYLYLLFHRQFRYECQTIPPDAKNILWINLSAPSLGDSLMDLSARCLIKNYTVDLFTDQKNSILYENDAIFNQVFTEPTELKAKHYDFILLDSYSSRSLKIKLHYFKNTYFTGIYGFLNGFDIHRTLYSYYRIQQIFNVTINSLEKIAKPIITVDEAARKMIQTLKLPSQFIAIVIGGEWEFRTYDKWGEFIHYLLNESLHSIILVGSTNGGEMANQLMQNHASSRLINFVGRLNLPQTVALLENTHIVVCTDGGLLHVVNALDKPTIALFATIKPQLRMTEANQSESLYDEVSVKNIAVTQIIEAYHRLKTSVNPEKRLF